MAVGDRSIYRVAALDPSGAVYQLAGPFDYEDEARSAAENRDPARERGHRSPAPEDPIRPDSARPVAEAVELGDEPFVEVLTVTETGSEGGAESHTWVAVDGEPDPGGVS